MHRMIFGIILTRYMFANRNRKGKRFPYSLSPSCKFRATAFSSCAVWLSLCKSAKLGSNSRVKAYENLEFSPFIALKPRPEHTASRQQDGSCSCSFSVHACRILQAQARQAGRAHAFVVQCVGKRNIVGLLMSVTWYPSN